MSTLAKVAVTALLSVTAFTACGQTTSKAPHKPVVRGKQSITVELGGPAKSADELKIEREYERDAARQAAHEKALWDALRTRVVSDAEMDEILTLGTRIIPYKDGGGDIQWCGDTAGWCNLPSNYAEIEQTRKRDAEIIFNNALLNQFKMRMCANGGSK